MFCIFVPMNTPKDFIEKIQASIADNTFVRLTMSKNKDRAASLKKVLIKLAIIKKQLQLSFVLRHETKDVTQNFPIEDGLHEIEKLLGHDFWIANLFTTQRDFVFEKNKKGKIRFRNNTPTFTEAPTRSHDKSKQHFLQKTNYLEALGILNANGNIQKDKGDKYKQIKKFVEIIDGLLKKNPQLNGDKPLRVVDMGSGKGYLTFALYDYLVNIAKLDTHVIGVEIRENLIEICNNIATNSNFDNLSFEQGFINNYDLPKTDVLIALHACDTATDDAIAKGIQANAQLIICAPCCHKQIRKQIQNNASLSPILNYGILKERQAEIVTDTIRALLLEAHGYKTKVFEFISTEHTGKNVMIVGQKSNQDFDQKIFLEKVGALKSQFGIEEHFLETLL